MKIYRFLNRCHNNLLMPFCISSLFLIISETFLLLSSLLPEVVGSVFIDAATVLKLLCYLVFCYFCVYMFADGKRGVKAFWSVLCLMALNGIIHSITISSEFFVFAVLLSVYSIFCFKSFRLWAACLIIFVITLLMGILIVMSEGFYNDLVMTLSSIVSNKGFASSALFGFVKIPISLFNGNSVNDCIFHKSFGGSYFIDEGIVTGAKDLFEAGMKGTNAYTYLSGHYYFLFVIVGVFVSLIEELKGVQKYVLCFVFAAAILSGNIWLFVMFAFFETPFYLLLLSLLSSLCYVSSYLLKICCGYLFSGSVVEMFMYIDNPVYLFSAGIIFVCIGFFASKYIIAKRSLSDRFNIYYPEKLKKTVGALGGITNIVKVKDNKIKVRNSSIVDTIKLDCEIDGNIVSCEDPLFVELLDYL